MSMSFSFGKTSDHRRHRRMKNLGKRPIETRIAVEMALQMLKVDLHALKIVILEIYCRLRRLRGLLKLQLHYAPPWRRSKKS